MNTMKAIKVICLFFNFFLAPSVILPSTAAEDYDDKSRRSSIVFATLGRLDYAFDIYTLPLTGGIPSFSGDIRITDANSVNYNGHFPSSNSSIFSLVSNQTLIQNSAPPALELVYVKDRNGLSNIYLDVIYFNSPVRKRSALEATNRVQAPLLETKIGRISMKDRPSIVGEDLIYVSTHEDPESARTSWAAVYSTRIKSGLTRRLTPYGVADFSPAVSPSGEWTAVASHGEKGWDGEVQELGTDIYVFRTRDGSDRVKIIQHGGWPSWVDESTLYFHRRSEDGWWSVYRASFKKMSTIRLDSVEIERVTPPGLHAFTPATAPGNYKFIAVATRRPNSEFRHIELFDVDAKEFIELTRKVSPETHHFNPFISPDSTRVGYHRCRGGSRTETPKTDLLLENLQSPTQEVSLFRIDGSFPSFSPGGDRIAYVDFPSVYVVNRDGSNRREVFSGMAFSTAWDPKRKGVIYTSVGPTFAVESTKVDILAINADDEELGYKMLTTGGENNAFPSPSPDGKWLVFRSGRSGHKNLYIMDAVDGERGGLHRLTEGNWTDTMCNWSPDGNYIAFASDRESPGAGSFELYMIHPNGTGLKKVIQSGSGGRVNHPWFSPDGKSIVFTSDYAAVSAEPISNPHHYQPYGEIYIARSDGSEIRRMTHNSYEDGTPTWVPTYIEPDNVAWPTGGIGCEFEDCHWLSETPKDGYGYGYGYGFAPLVTTRTQCGH